MNYSWFETKRLTMIRSTSNLDTADRGSLDAQNTTGCDLITLSSLKERKWRELHRRIWPF
jgi:hypothetical protein